MISEKSGDEKCQCDSGQENWPKPFSVKTKTYNAYRDKCIDKKKANIDGYIEKCKKYGVRISGYNAV